MTVSSATNEASFPGNGTATVFPLPFRFFQNSDIIAQLINTSTGAAANMTLGIDYTLAGAGDPEVNGSATGALTTVAAVPVGFSVFVRRELPLTQPTDIVNQGRFFPEIHETVFDRLLMQIQQQTGASGKALRVIPSEPNPDFLPLIAQRAGKFLSFDDEGNPVASAPVADSSTALRVELAEDEEIDKGANLIGFMGQTLASRLLKIRYVSDYPNVQAAVDTGANLLLWPAGENVVTSVTPRSFQVWQGVHRDASIMRWAPVNVPVFGYSMIQSDDDIQGFHIRGMTFVGNRQYQTSESTDNQDMGCLHLRGGSVIDVSVEDFVIRDFGMLNLKGDGTTSGHGALVGSRTGTGKKIKNVKFRHGEFRDNSNVPGVYVNGESTFNDEMDGIVVDDVDFYVDIATAIQNGVYILGDATNVAKGVQVGDVRYHLSKPIDCAIELNWCEGFRIGKYSVTATGTGICTPVLIRDGCESGNIGAGYLHKTGTGGDNAAGVSIVRFSPGSGQQKRLFVGELHLYNWGTGASGSAVNISGGSSGIDVSRVFLIGEGSDLIDSGFIFGNGVSDIRIKDAYFENVRYLARYAGAATNVEIDGGTVKSCGDGSSSLIISNAGGSAVTQNKIANLRVLSRNGSTANLVGIVSTSSAGNRVLDNELPSGMAQVNPSYLTSQATIRTVAPGIGKGLLGNQYQFAQGGLSITNGSSFTIGGNLDAQGPVCKQGDFVIATFVGDSLGATVGVGWVPASGQVRIRVANATGATINIPAGNWNVLIIPS